MLEALFGSQDAERVLLFLAGRGKGYGKEIADFWGTRIQGVQRQLDKLEANGVLVSQAVGRTRVYTWSPRWPFVDELRCLLQKAIGFLPDEDRQRLQMDRRRPRRRGKPL